MKKKVLCILMAAMMLVPTVAFAEEETEAETETGEISVELDYEADPEAFVGTWVVKYAYTAEDGIIEVLEDTCFLEMELSIDTNKLVDEEAYIHADATNLSATMWFENDDIDVDEYSCSSNWSDWTVVDVVGEGECNFAGATKFKVRDDDEGIFFDILTGLEDYTCDDIELMNVIGMNADGQLILGYSEDHIESDDEAEWEYAYIFELVEDEEAETEE
ncbi:MAG: hypothetical protein LUF30_04810 [Lachnospiraceae bacterium]|nr:hypothetical protein [Lachnospiraceae bacterium]